MTRAGGVGSQNTLAAQLGGEPGLHVPKSTNWNLLPRLLPRGPDWHAVAVVPCRLAKRAPLEPKAEPSGAGLSTKPSVSRQCGGEALRFPKPISARNSSTPQGPQALGSLAKGLGHPSLARPGTVGWLVGSGHLGAWLTGLGFFFFFFLFGKGGGRVPLPRYGGHSRCTTAIKRSCFADPASSFPCFREHGGGLAKGQLPW